MRCLLLAMLLFAPCLHADWRECFGALDEYRWFQVESVAEVEALPPGVTAVDARECDLDTVKALAGIPTIEAVQAPGKPDALAELKRLPKLRLLSVPMWEDCVAAVAALAGLEVLIAYEFQPQPTAESLAKLAALENLHTVVFGGSISVDEWNLKPEDLKALATLPALKRLGLGFSIFEKGALAELAGLDKIEELDLNACWPEDDAWEVALKPLKKLRRLRIGLSGGAKSVSFARGLVNLQALEVLDMDEWHIALDGVLGPAVASLPKLTELRAGRASVDAAGMSAIGTCKGLKLLALGEYQGGIDDLKPLAQLENLESIELNYNLACDAAIRAVAKLPRLERLHLFYGEASGTALDQFHANAPLRRLDLIDMDRFEPASLKHLVRLKSLRVLCVTESTELEGGFAVLADLKQITEFSLSHKNSLTEDELKALAQMSSLTRLRIASEGAPHPAGSGAHFAACARLESLDLPGWGEFPVAELTQLKKLTGLKSLRVVLDEATPEAIRVLASLESLEELIVGAVDGEDTDWIPLCTLPNLRDLTVMAWSSNPIPKLRHVLKSRNVRVNRSADQD